MLGYYYNSGRAIGIKALPVARGIGYALTGVPDGSIAEALSETGDAKEINYIIEIHKANKRESDGMSGLRPGERDD